MWRDLILGGPSFEQMVVDPKGEPNNFLSDAEMRGKFDTLVAPYLDPDSLDQLAKGILQLDDQKNSTDCWISLVPNRQQRSRLVSRIFNGC
ncbi:MAG: hypothetical protein Ct9H300mP14_10780 [Gammaproteobacteria bacterium]|nr:MAG: hypothetical protein Ct9H300mP14_10780 [Gammaproteobacteria bacterium]